MWGKYQLAGGPEFTEPGGEEHEGGALLEVVAGQGALRRALNLSRQVPLVCDLLSCRLHFFYQEATVDNFSWREKNN